MKNVFLVFAVLMTTFITFAQESSSKSPEQRAKKYVKQLKKEVTLTAAQSSKIEAIQLKCIEQVDVLKSKEEGGGKKKSNKESKEIINAANAEIKAILTNEQIPKFDAWLEEKKGKMKNKAEKKEKGSKEN